MGKVQDSAQITHAPFKSFCLQITSNLIQLGRVCHLRTPISSMATGIETLELHGSGGTIPKFSTTLG